MVFVFHVVFNIQGTDIYEKLDDGTYRDKVTGEITKKSPKIPYMYKPNPKPTFKTDKNGNIDLESIKGVQQDRPFLAKERKEMLDICNENIIINDGKEETSKPAKSKTREKIVKIEDTPTMQFPLKTGQLGYMTPALQNFLGFDSEDQCYTSKGSSVNKKLKLNSPCIVRLGIEKNRKQSFLCLLSSVYKFYKNQKLEEIKLTSNIESLTLFKEHFLQNLTIDKFLMAQNGILPQVFKSSGNIAISESYESYFLSKITKNSKLRKKLISSYENFINYFKSTDVFIDFTYLWDLVCRPKKDGGVLFQHGINLLIFKSPNNDTTSKIELICPSNYNSNDFFDINKHTLMIYSENNFYEPLCKLTRKNNRKLFIVKSFSQSNHLNHLKNLPFIKL